MASRFLVGRPVILTHAFLDDETVLTPAAVTVTVTADGALVPVVTGSATEASSVYTFPAGMLAEGVYTVHWDGVTAVDTEILEISGGQLFTIPNARKRDPDLTAQRFDTETVKAYREVVEDEFERCVGRSFIPVTRSFVIELDGSDSVALPVHDVRALKALVPLTGSLGAASSGTLAAITVDPDGILTGLTALVDVLPAGQYVATIAYGFKRVPEDIRRAAIIRLRYLLMAETSGIPDRATTFQPSDGGTYTLATPGKGGSKTGIPDVDATLDGYTFNILNSVAIR